MERGNISRLLPFVTNLPPGMQPGSRRDAVIAFGDDEFSPGVTQQDAYNQRLAGAPDIVFWSRMWQVEKCCCPPKY
jgi:hypothetical protein